MAMSSMPPSSTRKSNSSGHNDRSSVLGLSFKPVYKGRDLSSYNNRHQSVREHHHEFSGR